MEKIYIERLKPAEDYIITTYTTPNATHKHDKWELVIFEQGLTLNVVNGEKFEVSAGDIFLLGPPHYHAIKFITKKHIHHDIYFDNNDLEKIIDCYSPQIKEDIISGKLLIKIKPEPSDIQSILEKVKELEKLNISEQLNTQSKSMDKIKYISFSILSYILGLFFLKTYKKQLPYPSWFNEFLFKLQMPEVFTLKVNEIVKMTNYSHTQFSIIFKKYVNTSLMDYLINIRLNYAAELLSNSNDTTLTVCENCGYDSYSYFEKSFRKKYGCTPKQYRNSVKMH